MSREAALAVAVPETSPVPQASPSEPALNPEIPQSDAARFAALARKEAQNVRDREAYKAERAAFDAEKEKLRAVQKQVSDFEAMRSSDPIAALKSIGFSETDIFNYMANVPEKKEPTLAEQAIAEAKAAAAAEVKAYKEAQEKAAAETQSKKDAQLISGLKSGITEFIGANSDQFEYCAYYGDVAVEQAYEIIKAGLAASKGEDLIDFKEAVKMAEEYYEEKDQEMSKLKKRQPKETPAPTQTAPARSRTVTPGDPNFQSKPTIQRSRTLSNDARVTSASVSAPRQETHDQKKERLIAQIRANGLKR